jgi:hypothetical protein
MEDNRTDHAPPDCAYCPAGGADVCVRVQESVSGSPRSVYAHRACAEARNVPVLYAIVKTRTEHFA